MSLDERLRRLHDQLAAPDGAAGLDAEGALAAAHDRAHRRRRRRLAVATAAVLVVMVGLVAMFAAAGDAEPEEVATGSASAGASATVADGTSDGAGDSGRSVADREAVVAVSLEPTEGFFVEGFEVGLRFSTGDGEVIAATLWSDDVAQQDEDPSIDAYYDHVAVQPVAAGTVVVEAQVNVGEGPPPATPDLDGPMDCRLEVQVPAGSVARVEVRFSYDDRCLVPLGEPTPIEGLDDPTATTEAAVTTTTSIVGSAEEPVTTTSTVTDGEATPSTTTEIGAAPLSVGSMHYVDVDLQCQAFVLGGSVWRIDEGSSTEGWPSPGERHEGGTFTLSSPTEGEFVGDAARAKVATFTLAPEDPAACIPVPR
jgi:hypothetical protein